MAQKLSARYDRAFEFIWDCLLRCFWMAAFGSQSWGWCSTVNCSVVIARSCKKHSLLNHDILLKMRVVLHPTKHKIIPAAEQPLRAPGFCSLMNEGCEPGRVSRPLGHHRTFPRAAQDVSVLVNFSPSSFFSRGRVSRAGILHLSNLGVIVLSDTYLFPISKASLMQEWSLRIGL